ncbi:MAG: hypothetical protein ACLFNQ_05145 [Spirochaetaceae bacterium]
MDLIMNPTPRIRIQKPRWIVVCFVLFLSSQAVIVVSGPLALHAAACCLVLVAASQRIPARTLLRLSISVLLPAMLTGIARSGMTAHAWDVTPAFAVWLTTLRFVLIAWSAYVLTASCAIRQALLQTLPRRRSVRGSAALSIWFVLVLLPETVQILREARTAALFRDGIPLVTRLRAISTSVLPRILTAANNRADALALRPEPVESCADKRGIPPSE